MVKKYWLLIALLGGIVLGTFLTTFGAYVLGFSTAEADGRRDEVARENRSTAAAHAAEGAAPASARPDPAPARFGDRTAAPPAKAPEPQVALDIVSGEPNAGFVQGEVINAPPPRHVENMQTMHEDFKREERDDSWAYLREAELENSVVMETSVGNFSRERVECRATICEMDLSASGEQIEKLKKWYDDLNAQRPGFSLQAPLMMRMSMFSVDNDKATVKFVYVKPQRVLPPPRSD